MAGSLKTSNTAYDQDVRRAVEILRSAGCSDIYLFGSVATGATAAHSDIDIAVRGCPQSSFFRVLGTLLRELDHPVDLVDLDEDELFPRYLLNKGPLVKIA